MLGKAAMIDYHVDNWAIGFIFQCRGSVFPKAICWAIPNAVCAALLHIYREEMDNFLDGVEGMKEIWRVYTSVLGFLLVFRSNQAYARFWDGSRLIQQVRGAWFNAISNLVGFCTSKEDMQDKVADFQHLLIRLGSILYCCALQQVAEMDDDAFEVLEVNDIERASLDYLQNASDRVEIILQWITRLIMEKVDDHVIIASPPVLSRVFQELSRGFAELNAARNIRDIHFPFPYSQMVTSMVLVQWVMTVIIAAHEVKASYIAAIGCFFVTFCMWCLLYIALEIDQPFGRDANDLPLVLLQRQFNQSLREIMDPIAQRPPQFRRKDGAIGVQSSEAILGQANRLILDQDIVQGKWHNGQDRVVAVVPGATRGNELHGGNDAGADALKAAPQCSSRESEPTAAGAGTGAARGADADARDRDLVGL